MVDIVAIPTWDNLDYPDNATLKMRSLNQEVRGLNTSYPYDGLYKASEFVMMIVMNYSILKFAIHRPGNEERTVLY